MFAFDLLPILIIGALVGFSAGYFLHAFISGREEW
jgi:hypothetical protein